MFLAMKAHHGVVHGQQHLNVVVVLLRVSSLALRLGEFMFDKIQSSWEVSDPKVCHCKYGHYINKSSIEHACQTGSMSVSKQQSEDEHIKVLGIHCILYWRQFIFCQKMFPLGLINLWLGVRGASPHQRILYVQMGEDTLVPKRQLPLLSSFILYG